MMIGKFSILLLTDLKHCNKMRITEDCQSTRNFVKLFAEFCGVNLNDSYVNFLFEDATNTVFEFADETGKLLEIRRQPFTTRF